MTTQRKIVLRKPEDWDSWISLVRNQAESLNVWNLINPTLPVRPIALTKPLEPLFDLGDSAATFGSKAFEYYKAQQEVYNSRLAEYNEQKTGFTAIISFIHETITVENAILIQEIESHPYDLLVALKQRLAPTDQARSLDLEKPYEKLEKGLGDDGEYYDDGMEDDYFESNDEYDGNGDSSGEEKDFTACSSEDCGYCGRCRY